MLQYLILIIKCTYVYLFTMKKDLEGLYPKELAVVIFRSGNVLFSLFVAYLFCVIFYRIYTTFVTKVYLATVFFNF